MTGYCNISCSKCPRVPDPLDLIAVNNISSSNSADMPGIPRWGTTDWTECTANCDGIRIRGVFCYTILKGPVDDKDCATKLKPTGQEACNRSGQLDCPVIVPPTPPIPVPPPPTPVPSFTHQSCFTTPLSTCSFADRFIPKTPVSSAPCAALTCTQKECCDLLPLPMPTPPVVITVIVNHTIIAPTPIPPPPPPASCANATLSFCPLSQRLRPKDPLPTLLCRSSTLCTTAECCDEILEVNVASISAPWLYFGSFLLVIVAIAD